VVTATLVGVVTSGDQAEVVSFARASIEIVGPIKVLLLLEQFKGWNPDAQFDTEEVWMRDDEAVSGIAIVGDPAWKVGVLTVMAQPLRRVPIAYFATEESARRWLDQRSHAQTPAAFP
jgi:hypothetical protein